MGTSKGMARREFEPTSAHRVPGSEARVAIVPAPPVRRAPVLEVGAVHDAAEHEADRLAESVVARLNAQEAARADEPGVDVHAYDAPGAVRRMAAPTVGRDGGPASAELSDQIESMRGGGSALDADVRRRMGGAFGTDFSRVRVHTGEHAAQAASAMGALAFTTGNDIFFGAGQYRPDDAGGQHVLAHELAHTVQQRGGARLKVSRLWNLKTMSGADLTKATKVSVLKDRAVMFLQDSSDDTMVVKVEDQPIGLGALAGWMHKRITGTDTIDYLKYPKSSLSTLRDLLDDPQKLDVASWTARGDAYKANADAQARSREKAKEPKIDDPIADIKDPVERGVATLNKVIEMNPAVELLAMSVAPGETASKAHERPADDKDSLKSILERPGHMRDLGRLTALDLMLGNMDRVMSGNLGNWFYDPSGAMVVLDNVDSSLASKMTPNFQAGVAETEQLKRLGDGQLKKTAKYAVLHLLSSMQARKWATEKVSETEERNAVFEREMLEGLKEGKRHIVKVFSSTRLKGSSASHKAKKSIRSYARVTASVDADGGQDPGYYETLKARAAWLKRN